MTFRCRCDATHASHTTIGLSCGVCGGPINLPFVVGAPKDWAVVWGLGLAPFIPQSAVVRHRYVLGQGWVS